MAVEEVHALPHAQETHSIAELRGVEAMARIRNLELQRFSQAGKTDNGPARAAVSDDVLKRLLSDAEQTESLIGRHVRRQMLVQEIDTQMMARGEVPAKQLRRRLRAPESGAWLDEARRRDCGDPSRSSAVRSAMIFARPRTPGTSLSAS